MGLLQGIQEVTRVKHLAHLSLLHKMKTKMGQKSIPNKVNRKTRISISSMGPQLPTSPSSHLSLGLRSVHLVTCKMTQDPVSRCNVLCLGMAGRLCLWRSHSASQLRGGDTASASRWGENPHVPTQGDVTGP